MRANFPRTARRSDALLGRCALGLWDFHMTIQLPTARCCARRAAIGAIVLVLRKRKQDPASTGQRERVEAKVSSPNSAISLDLRSAAIAIIAGCLDVSGSALFIRASQIGRLDVSVVISSLYPAITVLLARLVLHEHFSRWRTIGMLAALAAVPMIAA